MRYAACLCLSVLVLAAADPLKQVFDRAVAALAAEDYPNAEKGFQAVLREQPRNVAALSNLGVIYSRTSRSDQAITVYRKALQFSPDDKAILLNLGLVYLRRDDHAHALPLFARVAALDPSHLQARQLLALCRAYTGQLAPAIHDLEALRAADPRDQNVLFLLGFVYLKNKDAEKAKAVFEQMFEAAGPVQAEFLLGKAYYEATQFPEAEQSLLKVLRLDPTFPGAHLELGKVYISMRRTDDAIRELQNDLKENPEDADASYFLGGTLVQDGRLDEGIPYLERAKTARPDFWAPYFYLGKAKLRLEQPAAAVILLQQAAKLNPEEASAYQLLGQALKASGRPVEASQAFRRVEELRAGAMAPAAVDDHRVAGAK